MTSDGSAWKIRRGGSGKNFTPDGSGTGDSLDGSGITFPVSCFFLFFFRRKPHYRFRRKRSSSETHHRNLTFRVSDDSFRRGGNIVSDRVSDLSDLSDFMHVSFYP